MSPSKATKAAGADAHGDPRDVDQLSGTVRSLATPPREPLQDVSAPAQIEAQAVVEDRVFKNGTESSSEEMERILRGASDEDRVAAALATIKRPTLAQLKAHIKRLFEGDPDASGAIRSRWRSAICRLRRIAVERRHDRPRHRRD
jgi:hypothetical protein